MTASIRTSTIQQIPFDAVERIEVLKDGASAIYGSDAVAGVVNIILRQQFTGVTATGTAGTNYNGDGNQYKAAITGGIGDLTKDRYNAYVTFDYQKQEAVPDEQGQGLHRDQQPDVHVAARTSARASPRWGSATRAANGVVRPVEPDDRSLVGGGPYSTLPRTNCDPANIVNGFCRYERQGLSRHHAGDRAVQRVRPRQRSTSRRQIQGYAELSYFQVKTDYARTRPRTARSTWYNPARITINDSTNIFLPVGHPDNPFNAQGQGARLYYTDAALGGRDTDIRDGHAALPRRPQGHELRLGLGRGRPLHPQRNERHTPRLLPLPTAAGGPQRHEPVRLLPCRVGERRPEHPGDLRTTSRPTRSYNALSENTIFDAKASRDIYKLDGGQLALAVGYEFRREELNNPGNPGTDTGNVVGLGYAAAFGSRNVNAIFAELYAPILKNLELTAAVRFDDYSDVGNTTNPKVGVKWTVVPQLVLRGTWATAFRAPGLPETSTANSSAGFVTVNDPVRCPVTGDPADCATPECARRHHRQPVHQARDIRPPGPRASSGSRFRVFPARSTTGTSRPTGRS